MADEPPLRPSCFCMPRAFLVLVLAQAAHSIEEYVARLYDVLAPARFVSCLLSDDPATGFAIANFAIVAFGLWCWSVPVRARWPSARAIAWGWMLVELGNGVVHVFLAVASGGYFPGVITAPFLIVGALRVARQLRDAHSPL
jgi:hypothetical protein